MKRFPAFDPPEYVTWQPDPALVRAFPEAWSKDPARKRIVGELDRKAKLALYASMLRTRLHDIMLKRWVRQGVISKAWLGPGEEAATVGPVHALDSTQAAVATLMRKAGISEFEAFARDILQSITVKPVSFEVFSDEFSEMKRQAMKINSWAKNVYVKIPITNTRDESSLALIKELANEGVLNISIAVIPAKLPE